MFFMQPIRNLFSPFIRKLTLLAVLLCLFAGATYAQGVKLGVKAGANMYKIDGQGYSQGYNLGYHLGGFLQLNLSDKFGIQPEVIFSEANTRTATNFKDTYKEFDTAWNNHDIRLNYLSIPILANIALLGSKRLKLQVGPQFSILMNKNQTLVNNGKAAFKNGDFSMIGGLWLDLPLGLNVDARYIVGLSNVSDLTESNKWRNQAIQLGVGFSF